MFQDDGTRFAIDASGLDDLPVGAPAGDLFLEGGQGNQCIQEYGDSQEEPASVRNRACRGSFRVVSSERPGTRIDTFSVYTNPPKKRALPEYVSYFMVQT